MPRRRLLPLAIALAALSGSLAACAASDTAFFVRNKGADMPVWVRGNLQSGKILIYLHGGPGSNGLTTSTKESFRAIEQACGVVYWDQRASGSSRGDAATDTLNLAQYVEDLDGVVETIKRKYPDRKLILLGHSWGGTLGSAYLLDAKRQAKVAGWIEVDGAHSVVEGNRLSWQWVKERAAEKVAGGQDADKWRKVLSWYDQNPVVTVANDPAHQGHVEELEESLVPPPSSGGMAYVNLGMVSPYAPLAGATNGRYVMGSFVLTQAFLDIDLTSELGKIGLPSLVLWGRHDGRLPVAMAATAFDRLGTPAASKSLRIFEHSAHSPHLDEPGAFADAVKGFVAGL
ncbi:MAG TPA: alpha/beta hydrolase [Pantanalinema sp.]